MHLLIAILLLTTFPLKAYFHYLYVQTSGGAKADKVTDYLYALPILSGPANKYKLLANAIVFLQYSVIITLLLINRKQLGDIWENWQNIP